MHQQRITTKPKKVQNLASKKTKNPYKLRTEGILRISFDIFTIVDQTPSKKNPEESGLY
jgi:hypothetical protein